MARNSYTQGSVADRMGRSQHYISRRLTGRVPFDTDDLTAIAEILGVKFSDLVSGPERTEAAS